MPTLSVVFRKEEIPLAQPPLRGSTAVVLDILRASSTIVTALAHGASELRLTATPQEARGLAKTLAPGGFLLGGERGGLRIAGFDLGNSPRDYSAARVHDKIIVFTTTNGTAAARACGKAGARHVLFGSLLNTTAVARAAAKFGAPVVLVCAGTEGTAGVDDIYAAGAFVTALKRLHPWSLDDSAEVARRVFLATGETPRAALALLRRSLGGRNLIRVGLGGDLRDCVVRAAYGVVPRYAPSAGTVTNLDG